MSTHAYLEYNIEYTSIFTTLRHWARSALFKYMHFGALTLEYGRWLKSPARSKYTSSPEDNQQTVTFHLEKTLKLALMEKFPTQTAENLKHQLDVYTNVHANLRTHLRVCLALSSFSGVSNCIMKVCVSSTSSSGAAVVMTLVSWSLTASFSSSALYRLVRRHWFLLPYCSML